MVLVLSELLEDLDALAHDAQLAEPEGLKKLRTGKLESRAGGAGSYFTTLDIAHGMLRDLAMYIIYPTLKQHRERMQPETTRVMIDSMYPQLFNFLGYSGFEDLKRVGAGVVALAPQLDAGQLDQLLTALLRYVNMLYSWAYHTFPWDLGDQLRYEAGAPEKDLPPVQDTLTPTETLIKLRWEPLGIEVRAFLATEGNSRLCRELLEAMPFRSLQTHAMVAGQSLMAFTPLTSSAPTPYKEELLKAPAGRLRFNAGTGQKFIVQYGRTTENIMAPVIGSVLAEDVAKLAAVGAAVWESTYRTKEEIWLTVERL
ncbi:hypothetical protein CLG85_010805 [Yangia mangrovi]|uniref:Cucumopine synthase C-terminal helical bundle domain-containing protein n=1 Tax=Alloyangia mangrovi TaxID=1779329 RepID=A0ABT2KKA3_9RHOB|nr:hypothetical protein [Alloyangia mangrovi]MCT4370778.1 hypothetical protein [Alloyangia mangrovi]